MTQALGMAPYVVRYQGGGHGLAPRSDIPCTSDLIDAYLFDLRRPSEGYTCPAVSPASITPENGVQALDAARDYRVECRPLKIEK